MEVSDCTARSLRVALRGRAGGTMRGGVRDDSDQIDVGHPTFRAPSRLHRCPMTRTMRQSRGSGSRLSLVRFACLVCAARVAGVSRQRISALRTAVETPFFSTRRLRSNPQSSRMPPTAVGPLRPAVDVVDVCRKKVARAGTGRTHVCASPCLARQTGAAR